MGRTKKSSTAYKERELHLPHELWTLSCELRGIAVLLCNQTLTSPSSFYFDEALEGLGRTIDRASSRLRKLSRIVDEKEVLEAKKSKRKKP